MENTYPYLQEESDQTSTETALLGLEDQYTPLFGFVERTSIFEPENHQLKEDESFHTNLPLEPDFVDNFEFEDTNLNELFTPPHQEDIGMKLEELEKSHDNLNYFDQMEDIKTNVCKFCDYEHTDETTIPRYTEKGLYELSRGRQLGLSNEQLKIEMKRSLLAKLGQIEKSIKVKPRGRAKQNRQRTDAARVKWVRYCKKMINELSKKYTR